MLLNAGGRSRNHGCHTGFRRLVGRVWAQTTTSSSFHGVNHPHWYLVHSPNLRSQQLQFFNFCRGIWTFSEKFRKDYLCLYTILVQEKCANQRVAGTKAVLSYSRSTAFVYIYFVLRTISVVVSEGSTTCLALAYVVRTDNAILCLLVDDSILAMKVF